VNVNERKDGREELEGQHKTQAQKRRGHMERKGNKPNLDISEILTRQTRKKSDCWRKGKGQRVHLT